MFKKVQIWRLFFSFAKLCFLSYVNIRESIAIWLLHPKRSILDLLFKSLLPNYYFLLHFFIFAKISSSLYLLFSGTDYLRIKSNFCQHKICEFVLNQLSISIDRTILRRISDLLNQSVDRDSLWMELDARSVGCLV